MSAEKKPDDERKVAYVGFAADIVHHGHVNIIREAAKLGRVVVGLLTDEAIASYKRKTIVKWENRRRVVQAFKGVDEVIPQATHDYSPNLRKLKPDYVVHGTDWREGAQAKVRQKCIDLLKTWGGELVEPEYTKDISTTKIIQTFHQYEEQKSKLEAVDPATAKSKAGQKQQQQQQQQQQEEQPEQEHWAHRADPLSHLPVADQERLQSGRPIAYVGVSTDFVHHGHIGIIEAAAQLGTVVVGLLSDEAVESFKHKPVVPFAQRKIIFENLTGVAVVVSQEEFDYAPNLRALKPEFVVHGNNWVHDQQKKVRQGVIDTLKEWDGKLVEPEYCHDFDSAAKEIVKTCFDRVESGEAKKRSAAANDADH